MRLDKLSLRHRKNNKVMALSMIVSSDALSTEALMDILPHRYPMLLVDRLENIVPGESATGIKNVTYNEPFFGGHFPGSPVMPGVLIVEAMAQTAGALVMKTLNITHRTHLVYFMSITDARFRKPVFPGDTLELRIQKKHQRGDVWKFYCQAYVKNQKVAEATYAAMITQK